MMDDITQGQIGCLVLLVMLLGAGLMMFLLILPMPLKLLVTGIVIGAMIGVCVGLN